MRIDHRTWGVLSVTCLVVVRGSLVIGPNLTPDWVYRSGGSLGVDHAPGQAVAFFAPPVVGVILALWPVPLRFGMLAPDDPIQEEAGVYNDRAPDA